MQVDSDLVTPDQIDRVTLTATDPGGRAQRASATLGPGHLPFPRTLTMVHEEGPLGPYRVSVQGERFGASTLRREGDVSFERGSTLVWHIRLDGACLGTSCGEGETCEGGACRPLAVGRGELSDWDGQPPPRDAGAYDACVPTERCNGIDDDCDGAVDEGFDLQSDVANCGRCGVVCTGAHATSFACAEGSCVIDACEAGFGNCDGAAANGCETDITTSPVHCGACGTACGNPERDCCAGTCARSC